MTSDAQRPTNPPGPSETARTSRAYLVAGMDMPARASRVDQQQPGPAPAAEDATVVRLDASRIRSAKRIHITGSPGSGKSTLARRLSASLGLPVVPLDHVAYRGPEFADRDNDARASEVRAIADQPQWVSEGIFVGWTQPLLEKADLIIWLDYLNWRGAVLRLLRRTIRGAVKEMQARQGTERFLRFKDYWRHTRQLVSVVVASREYWGATTQPHRYPVTRENIELVLAPLNAKVLHVTGRRQAKHLLDTMSIPALAARDETRSDPSDPEDAAGSSV